MGSITDITWKGNRDLGYELSNDFELKEKLWTETESGLIGVDIFPDEDGAGFFIIIRTHPSPPTANFFECLDSIAGHIHDYSDEHE